MILVFNPYFLDGIAWKYDSPGMAASILFPLIPFLFIGTARLYTISSLVCVLGMYLSYQASSGIYVMMAIFVALLKYITEEWSLSETAKFCAKSAGCFIVASALFYLVTTAFFTAGASRTTNVAIGFNVARNIAGYFSSIRRDFNSLWKALSLLAMLAAAFAACKLSKKKMVVTLPIFIIALALALLLSQGGYIFLADYAHAPRYKYGFGALLAMLASISVLSVPSLGDSWKKALAAAPAVLLAWSFFSYASAFGNAHANQMKMELQYQALVMQDISELFPREEYPRLTLALVGQMPWSGEVKNLVKAYPITAALVIRRHGGGSMNAWFRFTMRYFDPTLVQVWGNNLIIGKTTLLVSRRYYDILLEEGTGRVIVECKMELTVNS